MAGRPRKHKPMSAEAFKFIMALRGDRGVFISAIYYKSGEELSKKIAYNCYIEYEDLAMGNAHITEITRLNEKEKYEVFLAINHSTKKEPRKSNVNLRNDHIDEIIAQFVDFDCDIQQNWDFQTKTINIQEFKTKVKTLIAGLPLEPSIIVETHKGYHIYFKVRPAEGQTSQEMIDKFQYIQDKFIERFKEYGSDPRIRDPRRVMRLPGFYHNKDKNNPVPINIVSCSPDIVYLQDNIIDAFEITPPETDKTKRITGTSGLVSTANVSKTELKYLLQRCTFMNKYFKNPYDMGYSTWFGIGSNLCRCGPEGEELWFNMSQRDAAHFEEDDFPDYYEKVKNYIVGCEQLGCDKYRKYLKRRHDPKAKSPCGVGVPFDLFLKEMTIRNHNKKLDYSAVKEIDIDKAKEILREQVHEVLNNKRPGIFLFNGPFGMGKSITTLDEVIQNIIKCEYRKVLWLGGTHEQVNEMEQKATGELNSGVAHLKGLNQFAGFRCYFMTKKDLATSMGLKPSTSYCSICPNPVKRKCPYFRQWIEADRSKLVFGVHEHLISLEKIKPDLLILDENFLKANELFFYKEDIDFSISVLKEISGNVQRDIIDFFITFLNMVKNASSTSVLFGLFSNELLLKFGSFNSEDINTLIDECFNLLKTKRRNKQLPQDTKIVISDVLYWLKQAVNSNGSIASALRKIGLAAMEENIYLGKGNSKDEFRYSYSKVTQLPDDCTIIILDATGSEDFYQRALHKPVTEFNFQGYHIKQSSKMVLINHARYYASSIIGREGGPKETQDKAIEIIEDIMGQRKYTKPGVITFKGLESRFKKEFSWCVQDHFGNLRGKNTFRDCDAIFILGFLRYPAATIAKRAYQLFAMDIDLERLIDTCRSDYNGFYLYLQAPLKNPDSNYVVHKQLFHFEELALVFEAFCYGELLQAIGRARTYDKHREQCVYVMTECESSGFFIYDEVYKPLTGIDIKKAEKRKEANNEFIQLLKVAYSEGIYKIGQKPVASKLHNLAKEKGISISRDAIYEYVNGKRPWPEPPIPSNSTDMN